LAILVTLAHFSQSNKNTPNDQSLPGLTAKVLDISALILCFFTLKYAFRSRQSGQGGAPPHCWNVFFRLLLFVDFYDLAEKFLHILDETQFRQQDVAFLVYENMKGDARLSDFSEYFKFLIGKQWKWHTVYLFVYTNLFDIVSGANAYHFDIPA
jgi:hypothetical protein